MFHPDTQFLIQQWTRSAGPQNRAPARTLPPESLGACLPRAIVIDNLVQQPRLRVAGGWIEALQDLPLRGQSLFLLWRESSATLVASSLLRCVRGRIPVVLNAEIGARRQRLELAMVPLIDANGAIDRVFGLFTPLTPLELELHESPLLTARLSVGLDRPAIYEDQATAAPHRPAA